MTKKPEEQPSTDVFDVFKRGHFDVFGQQDDNASANLSPEQIEAFETQAQKEYELNAAIQRALSTPDGQTLYEFMREVATEGQRFNIGTETDALRAAAVGFFREGQAAFYFECKHRINRALQGPPTKPEQET